MATAKINLSGCEVRKGKVKLRFDFFLEPGDPRYEEYYLLLPIVPEEGYTGRVNEMGEPVNQNDYNKWLNKLPKQWQNTPCHSHKDYIDIDDDYSAIEKLMNESLAEFFSMWCSGYEVLLRWWGPKGQIGLGDMSPENIQRCELKLLQIASVVNGSH